MADWLKSALEWLKTSPRYFFPVAVASAAVLFLPDSVIKPLGLLSFRTEGQPYLGIAFLFSSCAIGCDALIKLFTWGRGKYQTRLLLRYGIHYLEHLTPREQQLLRLYLEEQTRTQEFSAENGVVAGLVRANILYFAVPQAPVYAVPYNLQPWAWEHLNTHPELVGYVPSSPSRNPALPHQRRRS